MIRNFSSLLTAIFATAITLFSAVSAYADGYAGQVVQKAGNIVVTRSASYIMPSAGVPNYVLVLLHGVGGNGKQVIETVINSHPTVKAQADNSAVRTVIFAPDAELIAASSNNDMSTNWRAGFCCGATSDSTTDVDFVNMAIDNFISGLGITRASVSVIGLSNGGMLAYHLQCRPTGKSFRSVAVVGGTLTYSWNREDPNASMCITGNAPLFYHSHGEEDHCVEFKGGELNMGKCPVVPGPFTQHYGVTDSTYANANKAAVAMGCTSQVSSSSHGFACPTGQRAYFKSDSGIKHDVGGQRFDNAWFWTTDPFNAVYN